MRNTTPLLVVIRLTAALGLLSLALAPRPAGAIGEQTGRIRGVVSDATSGARLPAATVTVNSPDLIGGARATLTDDAGRYDIGNLPPGQYTVEVSYPGMVPATRRASVQQGQSTTVNVVWSTEATGTDTVHIVSRRPLTRPDSTQMGTGLRYSNLAKLPVRRSYQDAAQQVAGVTGGANPNIKGGLNLNNRYLVDGLDITDPVTGTFSANLTFDATDAIDVITAGMEAQYNSLGGVINVLTQGGGDKAHVNTSVYMASQSLTAKGNFGPQLYDGRQPFNASPVGANESLQANITAGGPIIKNKLWVNGSYELRLSEISTVKGPPLGAAPHEIQHPPQTSIGHMARLKVTYAPSHKDRINFSAAMSPGHFNNTTQGNSALGVAETRQNQNNVFSIVSWDRFFSDAISTNLQVGALWSLIEFGAQGRLGEIDRTGCDKFSPMPGTPGYDKAKDSCVYDPERPRHVNSVDNTAWYQSGAYQLDNRYKIQVDPSVTLRGRLFGRHDVKAGLQMQYNYRTRKVEVPGGVTYRDGPVQPHPAMPLNMGLCDESTGAGCFQRTLAKGFDARQTGLGMGVYIQDRWWTPFTWLTVVPGLRFDWGQTKNRDGKTITNLFGVAPRLGFIADVTGDSRTTVFAYYGRHTETLSLLPASNFDANEAAVSEDQEWRAATVRDGMEIPAGWFKVGTSGGPGGVRVDSKAKTPHMDEISAGIRRAIAEDSVVELHYTMRHLDNMWAGVEVNRIWDPTGTRVVGWFDGMKHDILEFTTPDDNERTYHGFDLIAQGSPTPNWDFGASYTLSWLFGSATTVFGQNSNVNQYANPRQKRFFDGYLPGDIRHTVKVFGAYTILDRLNLGANFGFFTGSPITKTFFQSHDGGYFNYRSPLGTEPGAGNDPKTISEFRIPDRVFLDLRIACNVLPRRWGQKLNVIADIFNALNTRTPTAVQTNDIATFGGATGRQTPLRVQLGVQYLY